MRAITFAQRNIKEMLRDPISYIFLLAFPIIMLFVMSAINNGIPTEAQVDTFKIENLAVGVCVFGLSFDMLFAALQISTDRSTAFLTRLYSSPMKAFDFIMGYFLPLIVTAVFQCIIVFSLSALPFVSGGYAFSLPYILLSTAVLIPSAVMFIGIGILFGTLFNNKSAPPISSVIISLSGMIGSIWMDINLLGNPLTDICKALPFFHCTESGRAALQGRFDDIGISLVIVLAYATVIMIAGIIAFRKKSKV